MPNFPCNKEGIEYIQDINQLLVRQEAHIVNLVEKTRQAFDRSDMSHLIRAYRMGILINVYSDDYLLNEHYGVKPGQPFLICYTELNESSTKHLIASTEKVSDQHESFCFTMGCYGTNCNNLIVGNPLIV